MALVRTLVEEFHHFAAQNQLTFSVLENLKSTSKASDKRADDYPRIIANTRYMFGLGHTISNIQHPFYPFFSSSELVTMSAEDRNIPRERSRRATAACDSCRQRKVRFSSLFGSCHSY
jgi:site-specific DNA-cytosine methylase